MVAGCRAIVAVLRRARPGMRDQRRLIRRAAGRRQHQHLHRGEGGGWKGLTRALAREWAPHGIVVNCISPGYFPEPETLEGQTGLRAGPRGVPLGRFGRPREVGLLALDLASEAGACA